MNESYPLALPEGTILAGQYIIEKVLGQGGFGITYRAADYRTGQKVAVKEFFPDTLAYREATTVISYPGERSENYEYGKESFLQEAQTLAAFIGNENIVRIHSYFEENGTAYFVMDYIEGKSFDDYIKEKGGKISVEEAKAILIPVMDALNAVHSKGIVHRDVTPDNIYLTGDGTVKLLDFGAARYSLGDKSRSLDVILKHGFAPKEQYTRRGKQGPFTDIYSLAATFYFAITGKRPPDSVDRLDEDDLIPPSNLGVDITEYQERAILQALSVQPADRFQSMAVFKKVLLNENTVTNQIVFTAPETAAVPTAGQEIVQIQQGYPIAQQGYPADQQGYPTAQKGALIGQNITQTAQNATPQKQSIQQKLQQIKHKKVILGIACALVVIAFIGIAASSGKTDRKADMASSDSSSEENSSQSSEEYDSGEEDDSQFPDGLDFDDLTPSDGSPEPEMLAEETQEQEELDTATEAVTYDVSELRILGNTAANIKNCGILTTDLNNVFWIDDDRHSLLWNDEYLYKNREGIFGCLSYDNGILYFLYNDIAYMQDIEQGSDSTIVPELEVFRGDIQRLYVSAEYYFIYVDGALYRIDRGSGYIEDWIDISSSNYLTFDNEGWLYYIWEDSDGLSIIDKVAADDFSLHSENAINTSSGAFTDLAVDGDYVYVLREDGSATYIHIFYSDLLLVGDEIERDISAVVDTQRQGNGNYACHLNAIDDHIFFDVYDASGDSFSLHHMVITNEGYKSNSISYDALYPCAFANEGNYLVSYIRYDESTGMWICDFDTVE